MRFERSFSFHLRLSKASLSLRNSQGLPCFRPCHLSYSLFVTVTLFYTLVTVTPRFLTHHRSPRLRRSFRRAVELRNTLLSNGFLSLSHGKRGNKAILRLWRAPTQRATGMGRTNAIPPALAKRLLSAEQGRVRPHEQQFLRIASSPSWSAPKARKEGVHFFDGQGRKEWLLA